MTFGELSWVDFFFSSFHYFPFLTIQYFYLDQTKIRACQTILILTTDYTLQLYLGEKHIGPVELPDALVGEAACVCFFLIFIQFRDDFQFDRISFLFVSL
jgi:hypothetical protein